MTARLDTRDINTPFWLPSGHLQTIIPALWGRRRHMVFQRTRVQTPDADFYDIDWAGDQHQQELVSSSGKALILFHGLEGSSSSHYALSIAQYFRAYGWLVAIPHFRGCSGEDNLLPRSYHSGDYSDVEMMIKEVQSKHPHLAWYAAGVSLGGNALLKHLARGDASNIQAAAAISAPLDVAVTGHTLDQGLDHFLYTRMFLHTLKAKALRKARYYPGFLNVTQIASAKTFYEFDNAYTAPVHGFQNTNDYWAQASSKPDLVDIQTPCLILNAKNDPFFPKNALPTPEQASSQVLLHQPASGGHVGFMTATALRPNIQWLPKRLMYFFNDLE